MRARLSARRIRTRADAPSVGIRKVLIGGEIVAQDGAVVSRERHGRVLRR
jgi:N-acyl-D-amino-acid deacylase